MKLYRDRDWLEEHYVRQGLSLAECARLSGACAMTIRKWLLRHGLGTRAVGEHMRGDRNPRLGKPLANETREKIARSLTGHKRTLESRHKQSETVRGKGSHLFGKRNHGRGTWVVQANGATVYMRSLWEVRFADWLADRGESWSYEPTTFTLPDGSAYTPDFLSGGVYYEIKGWMSDADQAKIDALRDSRPDLWLMVLDRDALVRLGIDVESRVLDTRHITIRSAPTRDCAGCGQPFLPGNRRQRFCSISCHTRRVRKSHLTLTCTVCGTQYDGFPSTQKFQQTCSTACGRILGARKRSGPAHWTVRRAQ